MKFVITGSRDWEDCDAIFRRLSELPSGAIVIHGGSGRTDLSVDGFKYVADWSPRLPQIIVRVFKADWKKHGKAAGPIRNGEMLDEQPDKVLAFRKGGESSKGTTDCIKQALARGIPVEIDERP